MASLLTIIGAGLYWYFAAVPIVEHWNETGTLVAEIVGTGTLEARVKSDYQPQDCRSCA